MRLVHPAALVQQAQELRFLSGLRQLTPEDLVAQYGPDTRQYFEAAKNSEDRIITIVPAHNEREDLPAALCALAWAGTLAIVASNKSNDGTQDIAAAMGADVIEANDGMKMAATQAGMLHAMKEYGARRFLFTDADTLVPRAWARIMDRALRELDHGMGAMACGDSIVWHGKKGAEPGNWKANLLVNGVTVRGALRRWWTSDSDGIARGHNYGLSLGQSNGLVEAICSLDPGLFVEPGKTADDELIAQTVRHYEGARVGGVLAVGAWVLTRGDRLTDPDAAWKFFRNRISYAEATAASYQTQYAAERAA